MWNKYNEIDLWFTLKQWKMGETLRIVGIVTSQFDYGEV